jgi:hypothetical protein
MINAVDHDDYNEVDYGVVGVSDYYDEAFPRWRPRQQRNQQGEDLWWWCV